MRTRTLLLWIAFFAVPFCAEAQMGQSVFLGIEGARQFPFAFDPRIEKTTMSFGVVVNMAKVYDSAELGEGMTENPTGWMMLHIIPVGGLPSGAITSSIEVEGRVTDFVRLADRACGGSSMVELAWYGEERVPCWPLITFLPKKDQRPYAWFEIGTLGRVMCPMKAFYGEPCEYKFQRYDGISGRFYPDPERQAK